MIIARGQGQLDTLIYSAAEKVMKAVNQRSTGSAGQAMG